MKENSIKITETREKKRLDAARFSLTYKASPDVERAKGQAYDLLLVLASGNDAIMEISSGYTNASLRQSANEKTMEQYVEEFRRFGIQYKLRKVPSVSGGIFGRLFSGKMNKEDDEVLAYIRYEMLTTEDFKKLIPFYGARFYFAKRRALLGSDGMGSAEGQYNAVGRFLDLLDSEKLSFIEMAVFVYAYFGQAGVCTEKIDYKDLVELLKNE